MQKIVLLFSLLAFSPYLFGFETGTYYGESSGSVCHAKIVQNASSVTVAELGCYDEFGNVYRYGSSFTYEFGSFSRNYYNDGKKSGVVKEFFSKDILDTKYIKDGSDIAHRRELFENLESSIHFLYYDSKESGERDSLFDMILHKQ